MADERTLFAVIKEIAKENYTEDWERMLSQLCGIIDQMTDEDGNFMVLAVSKTSHINQIIDQFDEAVNGF